MSQSGAPTDADIGKQMAALAIEPSTAAAATTTTADAPSSGSAARVSCSGSCSRGRDVLYAPELHPFSAVVDIEDLRTVTIHGIPRPRPPIVPFLCPFRVHLEPGKVYRYCTCGRSQSQPFCDDEHGDNDPQPIEFSVDVNQSWHLICGCKYTLMPPFCDGSHIHAVDGYEEVSTVPVTSPAATAADKDSAMTDDSAAR